MKAEEDEEIEEEEIEEGSEEEVVEILVEEEEIPEMIGNLMIGEMIIEMKVDMTIGMIADTIVGMIIEIETKEEILIGIDNTKVVFLFFSLYLLTLSKQHQQLLLMLRASCSLLLCITLLCLIQQLL